MWWRSSFVFLLAAKTINIYDVLLRLFKHINPRTLQGLSFPQVMGKHFRLQWNLQVWARISNCPIRNNALSSRPPSVDVCKCASNLYSYLEAEMYSKTYSYLEILASWGWMPLNVEACVGFTSQSWICDVSESTLSGVKHSNLNHQRLAAAHGHLITSPDSGQDG